MGSHPDDCDGGEVEDYPCSWWIGVDVAEVRSWAERWEPLALEQSQQGRPFDQGGAIVFDC